MINLPNVDGFLSAASIGCIGALALSTVMEATTGRDSSGDLDTNVLTFKDKSVRAVFLAYGLVGIWIGARLGQAVVTPERWAQVVEMGWVYLMSTSIGSLFSVRGSWRSKWLLGISIVGLAAMTYKALG